MSLVDATAAADDDAADDDDDDDDADEYEILLHSEIIFLPYQLIQ